MNGSSDKRLKVLERITIRQIKRLLETLHSTTLHRTQFIQAFYNEHSQFFLETLDFLKDMGWVREEADQLIMSSECQIIGSSLTDEDYVAEKIIQAMTSTSNIYGATLAGYLAQFKVIGDEVIHRPSAQRRLYESAIRNFLIDARTIFYRKGDDAFVVNQSYIHLYFWAKNVKGPKSKEPLKARFGLRERLGASAEYAVFQHEKFRVGEGWAAQVEYVASTYPLACYDVKSVTLVSNSTIPRYIEVKAVSAESYEFYWSSSELEAARLLKEQYFLYLLPVVGDTFDFSKLLILENPYTTVYKNSESWLIEENVILCRRKQQKEALTPANESN